jgi:hypothetical protein
MSLVAQLDERGEHVGELGGSGPSRTVNQRHDRLERGVGVCGSTPNRSLTRRRGFIYVAVRTVASPCALSPGGGWDSPRLRTQGAKRQR